MTVFGLNPDYESTLDKSNKYTFVNSLYLYGLLAKENAFDVAAVDDDLYSLLKRNDSAEFNVDCVLSNCSIYKATLFWWIDDLKRQHGLVVRRDDSAAIQFASKKLKEKARNLT
jgi:hypothetical protein